MVIGHEKVRKLLAAQQSSFALLGPIGVGKSLIAKEWSQDMGREITLIDGQSVLDWTPYFRRLEEEKDLIVVISDNLPPTIISRLPTFRVGYLTEDEVVEVLTHTFPKLKPRKAIAQLLNGSFENLDTQVKVAQTLPTIQSAIKDKQCPNLRVVDPLVAFTCIKFLVGIEVSKGNFLYKTFLGLHPRSSQEARNLVGLFFRSLR